MKIIPSFLTMLCVVCIGPLTKVEAVNPPPDGGYLGGNTAEGQNALLNLTTGSSNTAVGLFSLRSNTTGNFNTATGATALQNNITGSANTANGEAALFFNTTGGFNTAVGASALVSNTTGQFNTANGANALRGNTTAAYNTGIGFDALLSNSAGTFNTALGAGTLLVNTADQNTATGAAALLNNSTGGLNTANGEAALFFNSSGNNNTGIGQSALQSNTTGSNNVALGAGAGFNATTGSNNVYIGQAMQGVAGESNACYIASIFGQTSANGVPVLVNSNNKLGTTTSSKRFKEDIKPIGKTSEALLSLKPVSFRYKKEIDPTRTSQFGLVAEEVEKVNPDLVVRDKEGKPYSVRYDQVNAMLLNEFLKEHSKIEQQDHRLQEQEAIIARQQRQIEALTTGLQKVSAQLQLGKPEPQTVLNNH